MNRKNSAIIALLASLSLMGCASQQWWYKPGFTQAQFNKDDYSCQRDNTVQTGYFSSSKGAAIGSVGPELNRDLYIKCMQALGYTLGPPPTAPPTQTKQSDQVLSQGNPEKRIYPVVTGAGPINEYTIEKYDSVAVINFTDAPGAPNSGNTVVNLLSSMVGDTGITIVERTRVEQIFEEQRLQLISGDETINALKVGKLAGAKALVVGDINVWETNSQSSKVSISVRMIDVETGSVLFSGMGYWPRFINDPPETAAMKILWGLLMKLSSQIGTGTGAIGVTFDVREEHGAPVFFVRKVLPGWPAEAAGLKPGDVILTCNGSLAEKLKNKMQFTKACHADSGQSVSLEVARGDQRLLIKATAR